MHLRSPSEDTPRKPRIAATRSPGHKGRLREPRQVLPLVDFWHPTAHSSTVNRVHVNGSLRRHWPRAGFGYPLRDSSTAPADTTSRVGAPMGFTLQGVPLDRGRSTFRWPCLPDVTAYRSLLPKEEGRHVAAFKASFPRRVRAAPKHPEHKSRFASAVDPFLRFIPFRVLLPPDLARAFYRRASPRTLGRGDVPVRPGLRVSGIKRVGHPVSGVPTLLGFVTLRMCGAPSVSPKGPDHRRSARSSDRVLLPSHLDSNLQTATQPPKWPPPLSRSTPASSADALLHRHPRTGITPHDRNPRPTVTIHPSELSSRAAPRGADPL
jgi:hypothetical protein